MSLTIGEKERIRYFLGYPNTTAAASLQLGMVRSQDMSFLVDLAMENLRPEAEATVRSLIQTLDDIECVMRGDAIDRLAASRIGNLQLNAAEPEALEAELRRWAFRLADTLGSAVYPYSHKFQGVNRGKVGSIRRRA